MIKLPPEVWLHIFSYIQEKSNLLRLIKVNKEFRDLIQYVFFTFTNWPLLQYLLKMCPHINPQRFQLECFCEFISYNGTQFAFRQHCTSLVLIQIPFILKHLFEHFEDVNCAIRMIDKLSVFLQNEKRYHNILTHIQLSQYDSDIVTSCLDSLMRDCINKMHMDVNPVIHETNYTSNQEFLRSVQCDNVLLASFFLYRGADINYTNLYYQSALMLSAECHSSLPLMRDFLLMHPKIDVNLKTHWWHGSKAHHFAAKSGNLNLLKKLVNSSNVNEKDECGETMLQLSIKHSRIQVFDKLMATPGIDVNLKSGSGTPTIMYALFYPDNRMFSKLLEHPKIDLHLTTKNNETCLMYAVRYSRNSIPAILRKVPDIINWKQNAGLTALHLAIYCQCPQSLRYLLNFPKIDVNIPKNDTHFAFHSNPVKNDTPLMFAARTGNKVGAKMLLTHEKIDVNITRRDGTTALLLALDRDNFAIALEIVNHPKTDVNQSTRWAAPLTLATSKRFTEVVRGLLKRPELDVNVQTGYQTALYLAVQKNDIQLVVELTKHPNIDLNILCLDSTRKQNKTALALAAEKGYNDIVDVLLQSSKIDVNRVDWWSKEAAHPLTLALQNNHYHVCQSLNKDHRTTFSQKNTEKFQKLCYALHNILKEFE